MNRDEFLVSINSRLPSDRMRAAQWVADENRLDEESRRVLVKALASERVPQIRQRLTELLRASRDSPGTASADRRHQGTGAPGQDVDVRQVLDDLAGMIAHELNPAIGWVRHAANREIEDFPASSTNSMIEALRRRVDGLAKIASANRVPVLRPVPLHELLSSQVGLASLGGSVSFDSPEAGDDTIVTDSGLFSLILENAIQSAVDATRDAPPDDRSVLISSAVTDRDFWVKVSNRFVGAGFEYSAVSATGRTSKANHRGLGTRVMEVAASRLGYRLDVRAAGGVATFTLYGARNG